MSFDTLRVRGDASSEETKATAPDREGPAPQPAGKSQPVALEEVRPLEERLADSVKAILAEHRPPPLDEGIDGEIERLLASY